MLAAGRVRSKKKDEDKIRPTQNAPRNPQQTGDHVYFETALEATRPTR